MYELTGTIDRIFDTQTFPSGFTKREFVVKTDGDYPQPIKFALVKDRTALIDGYKVGDRVTVKFDLRGNEFKERFYVDLNAWRIEREAGGSQERPPADDAIPDFVEEEEGDMPF